MPSRADDLDDLGRPHGRLRQGSEPLDQLRLGVHAELAEYHAQVIPHGARAQVQRLGDGRWPLAAEDSVEDLPLTAREFIQSRIVARCRDTLESVEDTARANLGSDVTET